MEKPYIQGFSCQRGIIHFFRENRKNIDDLYDILVDGGIRDNPQTYKKFLLYIYRNTHVF